jgi:hypothetical protein
MRRTWKGAGVVSDWTRGDDPVYDGYRQCWQAQAEAEHEAESSEEEPRALAATEPKGDATT